MLENLDILTPNKLILGSNNFEVWFKKWLTSLNGLLLRKTSVMAMSSYFSSRNKNLYGIIVDSIKNRDDTIRTVEIEYRNHSEIIKRCTQCGVLIAIHTI